MPDDVTPPSVPPAAPPADGAGQPPSPLNIADELKDSYLTYAMSVIISRALPDVRDGLKPSQRRRRWRRQEPRSLASLGMTSASRLRFTFQPAE